MNFFQTRKKTVNFQGEDEMTSEFSGSQIQTRLGGEDDTIKVLINNIC